VYVRHAFLICSPRYRASISRPNMHPAGRLDLFPVLGEAGCRSLSRRHRREHSRSGSRILPAFGEEDVLIKARLETDLGRTWENRLGRSDLYPPGRLGVYTNQPKSSKVSYLENFSRTVVPQLSKIVTTAAWQDLEIAHPGAASTRRHCRSHPGTCFRARATAGTIQTLITFNL